MVKLKKGQEAFVIVDGPDTGRKFEPGVEYDAAPKGYESRFEKVKLGPAPRPTIKTRKGDK